MSREPCSKQARATAEASHLLCFGVTDEKQESRLGSQWFDDLGSLAGKPEVVRTYAINQKLQAVGVCDARDESGCPIGFFWENGRMRPFPELIPEEFRTQLRSAIPYLITDTGAISFRVELKSGPLPQSWPKRDFLLEIGESGRNRVSEQVVINHNTAERWLVTCHLSDLPYRSRQVAPSTLQLRRAYVESAR